MLICDTVGGCRGKIVGSGPGKLLKKGRVNRL